MNRLLKSMCAIALAIPALAGEITVTGKGSVSLPPDKMKMTFEVSAIDLDIAAAKRTFKERTAILSATLAKVGVATNEVLTSGMDMASELFPDPLKPVITVNALRGISTLTFFRLLAFAPWMERNS